MENLAITESLAKLDFGVYNRLAMIEKIHKKYPIINTNEPIYHICQGADPFVFESGGKWHLLLQEDFRSEPEAHNGISGYTIRTAENLEALNSSEPRSLVISKDNPGLRQVWAAEIHGDYLYAAASCGRNENHRMHIYKTLGASLGPWEYVGKLKTAKGEDFWAIDLTIVEINGKKYGVWSGWHGKNDKFPQYIYIAEMLSPTEIGPRHLLMSPKSNWCSSIAPILEGPQAIRINDEFFGLTITGNASWTKHYATSILRYSGGNPLKASSWQEISSPIFEAGFGIGHGIILQNGNKVCYIGHHKTSELDGWEDRAVFLCSLSKEKLNDVLKPVF